MGVLGLLQDRLVESSLTLNLTAPLAVVVCALFWQYLTRRSPTTTNLPLPPGPPRFIPWVGNAFEIPAVDQWHVFEEWRKKYGDIVYAKAFGQHVVVLNSLKACTDIFDKKSANFSSRPRMPMLRELVGWEWALSFMPYGDTWRRQRRNFHQHFNQNQVYRYRPVQLRTARALLLKLYDHPEDFSQHLRHTLASTIIEITYGIKVSAPGNSKYVEKAEDAMYTMAQSGNPSRYLVTTFPILKHIPSWLPGAQFKRDAEKWWPLPHEMMQMPFDSVLEDMRNGTAQPSVLRELLTKFGDAPVEERADLFEMARNVCGIAYAGGADTTISSTHTFVLAMAMHSAAQTKAQSEIDRVTGGTRLPDFDDMVSMPYVQAVCKEVMRWQPVLPVSVVHSSMEADEYMGYYIPKGAFVFGNSWSILYDPVEYPDPESFNPDRFMIDGRLNPKVQDPNLAAFGYGRRICPGRFLSDQSLFIIVSSVLSVFDIKPPLDEQGRPIALHPEMSKEFISYPLPFKCIIKPRSSTAEKLLRECDPDAIVT